MRLRHLRDNDSFPAFVESQSMMDGLQLCDALNDIQDAIRLMGQKSGYRIEFWPTMSAHKGPKVRIGDGLLAPYKRHVRYHPLLSTGRRPGGKCMVVRSLSNRSRGSS